MTIKAEIIRLLIVENKPALRKGLRMRLNAESDLSVIGEVADCQSALDLANALSPDLVLIDVDMPLLDGIASARGFHSVYPQAPVIVLSFQDDLFSLADAKAIGAAAFVTKSMPTDILLTTIRQVASIKSAAQQGGFNDA